MNRAERRYRAQRIAAKRLREYLRPLWQSRRPLWLPPWEPPPVGRYRKTTAWGCHHCTKHRKGSPHYGWGACHNGEPVRPTVNERHRTREIIREWIDGA